jgi:hypothetical protein
VVDVNLKEIEERNVNQENIEELVDIN